MTSYNTISDAEIASGKPVTNSLMTRLRNNLLAMLEGDVTAPKIALAALATVPGQNTTIYNAAGTYTLPIPAGVSSVEVDATGGGGDMYDNSSYVLGGGSGERRLARIAVTPLEDLTVIVGAAGASGDGGSSFVKRGSTVLVEAKPGKYRSGNTPGIGGTGGYGGAGFAGASGGQAAAGGGTPVCQHGSPHGGNTESNGAGAFSYSGPSTGVRTLPAQPGLVRINY
jgi:hypothetical protein